MKTLEKINRINEMLTNTGRLTAYDLNLDCSPCIGFLAKGEINELLEVFDVGYAIGITYYAGNGKEIIEEKYGYYELSKDIIDEIYHIIEDYTVSQEKDIKNDLYGKEY